ncbi:LacI family transcriptional regulator [Paenibacillus pasadenensis]|uniref:LacI family DNA-binding transcriptional regulator n=1 Tax=Paenibacillus pasadenensis TaxID=217090 RepID=UPI00203C0F14|nr:LacI family transcriptional regulator [Paenibacillus pasadenensis]
MKYNLKEVARLSGVSASTVSKIIHNYSDVGEDTKKKVLRVLDELGYTNKLILNKGKKSRKFRNIAVIFAGNYDVGLNHVYFSDVVNSFKFQMDSLGYDMIFFPYSSDANDYVARCKSYKTEGCLIIGGNEKETVTALLNQSEIPCVGIDISLSGGISSFIMTDNKKIALAAVEHLYLKGYKEVGFIGSHEKSEVSDLREQHLIEALKYFGLTVNPNWFVHGNEFSEASGYQAMQQLLKQPERPQSLFAASDSLAIGAMKAAMEHNLRIPFDMAIVGCDDIEAAKFSSPPLTTIRQDKEKIGKLAALVLNDLINELSVPVQISVEPELIVRSST